MESRKRAETEKMAKNRIGRMEADRIGGIHGGIKRKSQKAAGEEAEVNTTKKCHSTVMAHFGPISLAVNICWIKIVNIQNK
jgi:hypothetical protein